MDGEPRGLRILAQGMLGTGLLLLATSACAPALVGGGVLATLVGVAAATSHCYDYLDVSVLDADGRRTCAATVTATNRGDQFELTSCYYAPLTDGRWTLRASLPGHADAVSTVEVEHAHDCVRHVLSVELTLKPTGSTPAPTPPSPAVAAPPLATPPAIPPPAMPLPAAPSSSAAPSPPATGGATPPPPASAFPERPSTAP